ncbi:MAG: hypothetical protein L3J05_05590, partial [Robiginitomaculum sp.]|nr:hypothetical protein [Robiginitomaculum sp.]
MAKLCRIEQAIGEERAAVIDHKRDIEYYVRRWSDRNIARKGEVFSARVLRIDKDMMAAFVDMGSDIETKIFSISNSSGAGVLTWNTGTVTYDKGNGWITAVAPVSGSGQGLVSVTVSRQGLEPGIYMAVIPISSNGGNANVNVRMVISES